MKLVFNILFITLISCFGSSIKSQQKTSFTNPIIWADAPDLSIVRKGDTFYLISTTMHLMPGGPIFTSKDLVHWGLSSYVFQTLNDHSKYDLIDGTVYGRGQWASSIAKRGDDFYVLFSPNDEPFKSYVYTTKNPETEPWKLVSRLPHFHDASLFFDDNDNVYVFSGNKITELQPDLKAIKKEGLNTTIFERDSSETGLLEGNQVIKYQGKYYMMMISWPQNGNRRQVVYKSDQIAGPYEKKVILEDAFLGFPYAAQGALIDDEKGNWYAMVFQDRNGVGRVPLLIPVQWKDGWPVLGDNGKVPFKGEVPLPTYQPKNHFVESDDFSSATLKKQWQWNHNPQNEFWNLNERKGHLRLYTNRIVNNLYEAPNSLTQRMEGPQSSGTIKIDVSKMKNGDIAGFSAFNGDSGIISVIKEEDSYYITFSTNNVSLDNKSKKVLGVNESLKKKIKINSKVVYLKIDADFNLGRDIAQFSYSLDSKKWNILEDNYTMIFDYRRLFMGSKFAIFNYATKELGGYVDVDFFEYQRVLN